MALKSSLVFMVEPVAFEVNPETMATNAFQNKSDLSQEVVQEKALAEFKGVVKILRANGVRVKTIQDIKTDKTPDSIFPNNWVSFHKNGAVILYPMCAENRRRERRLDFILEVVKANKLKLNQLIDFSFEEHFEQYLEGTGSIVFDHEHKLAYACRSERMHEDILQRVCKIIDYQSIIFSAVDQKGQPIYHTNVMMAMGQNFVVVCLESIADEKEREILQKSFAKTGKKIIEISYDQMHHFCGNVLELFDEEGQSVTAMSSTAYENFTKDQKQIFGQFTKMIHAPIPTIEECGGGSVRCMICEVG